MEAAEADTGLRQPSRFAAFFGRRAKTAERNLVDEVPAFQRVVERADATAPQAPVAMTEPLGRSSIWERTSEPEKALTQPVPFPAPAAVGVRPETAIPVEARRTAAAEPRQIARTAQSPAPAEIAIHERADADVKTVTMAPKNVSGFKLPSSTLLTRQEAR